MKIREEGLTAEINTLTSADLVQVDQQLLGLEKEIAAKKEIFQNLQATVTSLESQLSELNAQDAIVEPLSTDL